MKTAAEYLDAIKTRHHLASDYAAAQKLGISRQRVSAYRSGSDSFSEETAARVAELLDCDPEEVVIAAHAERAKDAKTRALWTRLAKKAGYAAGVVMVAGAMAGAPAPAQASSSPFCIMSTSGNRRRRWYDQLPAAPEVPPAFMLQHINVRAYL